MFYKVFFPLHVKQSVIISNKHDIYKLLHELPKELSLLANSEISGKSLNFMEL